jgi:hypothetical protein
MKDGLVRVERMGQMRKKYLFLVGNCKDEREVGRPKNRWALSIEMNLTSVVYNGCELDSVSSVSIGTKGGFL